ncbi:transcription factor bHLH25-like isoform X2 [Cicer arietinum]|uniref:Transcription factor bHLH18-like isoform X2 n=1 Tax=Cicer arietinum TaxID=3827 RepID=A0A1S3E5E7_CICAR|nr:transcription factor bHLH18-like isoform X2 [Cicer arietinum]
MPKFPSSFVCDLENMAEQCQNSIDDDDEFLRNIFLQQPEEAKSSSESENQLQYLQLQNNNNRSEKRVHNSKMTTPRTFIISFDKSTIIPAATVEVEEEPNKRMERRSGSKLPNSPLSENKKSMDSKSKANQGGKKSRSDSQYLDHIIAERKRRLELTQKFIALSATIPGLKKTDKTTILGEAISYVKVLKERVRELEERNKMKTESTIILNKNDFCSNDTNLEDWCELLPDVKVRVLENEVLIEIHCEKQNGIEIKILDLLENNLHLLVTASSVLPFGNSTLGITIIAQMGVAYKVTVNDLVKPLRQLLLNIRTNKTDPY